MEILLNKEFEDARAKGRKIDDRWLLRHAKKIYQELHPKRVTRLENGMYKYLRFRFSHGWFNGFKQRFNISFRAGTKRAQKAPEELRLTIQAWLQFNCRNTVVLENSDCGTPCGKDIPVVGRFKLSEIANMDQSPLPFELCKGRTYNKKGEKTIRLKGLRSGWENRQCTLQIVVFADGIARCKPLLIYRGQPETKDR